MYQVNAGDREKERERDGEKKIDRFERLIHVELAKLLMRAQNTP